jgi:hypothetical protein
MHNYGRKKFIILATGEMRSLLQLRGTTALSSNAKLGKNTLAYYSKVEMKKKLRFLESGEEETVFTVTSKFTAKHETLIGSVYTLR